MRQAVTTTQAPAAPALYSQAVKSDGFIFVAGQIHLKPDNTLLEGNVPEKVAQIMHNIAAILQAAGATFDNIVKVTVYLTDIAMLPEFNEVYPSYFKPPMPARETVCVQALPLQASIEISVIAKK